MTESSKCSKNFNRRTRAHTVYLLVRLGKLFYNVGCTSGGVRCESNAVDVIRTFLTSLSSIIASGFDNVAFFGWLTLQEHSLWLAVGFRIPVMDLFCKMCNTVVQAFKGIWSYSSQQLSPEIVMFSPWMWSYSNAVAITQPCFIPESLHNKLKAKIWIMSIYREGVMSDTSKLHFRKCMTHSLTLNIQLATWLIIEKLMDELIMKTVISAHCNIIIVIYLLSYDLSISCLCLSGRLIAQSSL